MEKKYTKKEIYKKVLRDVSAKFIGTEKFINERIKEICLRGKLSAEDVIFLCVKAFVSSVYALLLAVFRV